MVKRGKMTTALAIFFILTTGALWGASSALAGRTFHVAVSGQDANLGSAAQPWRSLSQAARTAGPGDVVKVHPGVYDEDVRLTVSGTDRAPITFTADPPGRATIKSLIFAQGASHLRLAGFVVTGYKIWGIELPGDNHHLTFSGLHIKGGETGLRLTVGDSGQPPAHGPVSHVTLEDCLVQNTVYTGVDCTPGPCHHLTLRRVEVSGAGMRGESFYGSDGIAVEKGSHLTIEDCYVHDNGGDGIDLNSRDRQGNVEGIVVRGNVVAKNRLNGIKLWAGGLAEKNVLWGMGENPLLVGIFPCRAEIRYNTIAYNMWAKGYGGRDYAATFGHPEESGPPRPRVELSLHHNIFAFNTGPAHGEPTGIYLGPGVRLLAGHHNVFFSRADNEIFLASSRDEGREFSRSDIARGAWAKATGQGKDDLTVNPGFVSGWPKVDLHLKPGSPAAGRGAY
jgi:Right handed beta helix region/Protein of unknown function (DUF1565)